MEGEGLLFWGRIEEFVDGVGVNVVVVAVGGGAVGVGVALIFVAADDDVCGAAAADDEGSIIKGFGD